MFIRSFKTFRFFHVAEEENGIPAEVNARSEVEGRAMTPALTILIADRHEDVLNTLNEQLAATDYALLHAKSGEEAIAFLDLLKSKIELAIIDLELPDFSGLIGRLTLHDRKPVKIIATTSIYSKKVLGKMRERGVDAVVRKPTTHQEWRKTLESVIAQG
jgi:CheY-like chemotaxis protein